MNTLTICKIILLLSLVFTFTNIYPQNSNDNSPWMRYLEEIAESESNEISVENLFEELSYLSENPFNLYTVTKTDLERLPFLTDNQIENLLYYIYKYSPLLSIYELKNVKDLDMQTISCLLPFVYIGDMPQTTSNPSFKKVVRYSGQELQIRSDYCFQEKAGYTNTAKEEKEASPGKYYLGENYYLALKYGFRYKEKIQFGLVAEKDAGEAFFNEYHKGFDYYSFNLVLKNIGKIQSLYLGDYRLSFGQGLVANNDFAIGKTSDVLNINKKNQGLKRHFSTSESDYLRGIASSFSLKNTDIHIFFSFRKNDATTDSSNIYSFKTDGYNRTLKDLEKKNQASTYLYGSNVQWQNNSFSTGITAIYYSFGNKELNPEMKPYNAYYLRGKNNFNIGFNYSWKRKKYTLEGETAFSPNGGMATINNLVFNPVSAVGLAFSYRDYKKDYQAHYARSLTESSSVQNESGFYTGIHFKLIKHCQIKTYIDIFSFPWLKYGIDLPSTGTDALLQIDYQNSSNLTMGLRYKYKNKYQNVANDSSPVKMILPYRQHKIRYQVNYQNANGLSANIQINYSLYDSNHKVPETGTSFSASLGYNPEKQFFRTDFGIIYFNTSSWETRINMYEKNILYSFNYPNFSGQGWKYYTILKFNISKKLIIQTKFSALQYFDRDKIGSGTEEIDGKQKFDIYCLLRFKF